MNSKINNNPLYKSIKSIIAIALLVIATQAYSQVAITTPSLTLTACNTFPTIPATLGNIIIKETQANDIKTSGTLILRTPANFQFTSAGTASALGTEITGISIIHSSDTTVTLSFTVNDTLQLDTITISGIQVIATTQATTASNIINSGGTALVKGDSIGAIHAIVESTDAPVLSSVSSIPAICSGDTVNYIPTSTLLGTTFNWTRAAVIGISDTTNSGTNNPNEILTDTSTTSVNLTYVYTLTANGCTNASTFSVMATVNPMPTLLSTLSPPAICSENTFSYLPSCATPGTAFNWTRDSISGISNPSNSGTNNPNEILINTTNSTITVSYIYTLSANGCTNTDSVTVAVNPKPSLVAISNDTLCNSNTILIPLSSTINSTYTWFAIDNANTTGESITNQTTDTINNIITNNSSTIQRVNYAVIPTSIANSCIGDTTLFFVDILPTVTVNTINDYVACYQLQLSQALSSNVPATYSWNTSNNNSISGESSTPIITDTIIQTLVNNDTSMQTLQYVVTPTSKTKGCIGITDTFNVILNGNNRMTSNDSIIACHGTALNFYLTSEVNSYYNWVATDNMNVSGESTTLQSNDTITDILINLSNTIQTINYTVTPTAYSSSCAGTPQNLTVVLQPSLSLITNHTLAFCAGTTNSIGGPAINNCSYLWTPSSNLHDSTNANPLHTAINNTNNPLTIKKYVLITDTISNCQNTDSVSVTINPQPSLVINQPPAVCQSNFINLTNSATTQGSTGGNAYSYWQNSNATDTLLSTLISTSDTNFIKLTAIGGCFDIDSVITVVNPLPIANAGNNISICSGVIDSIGSPSTNGYSYLWNPGIGLSDSTNSNPQSTLTNFTSLPITTNYKLTTTINATGCKAYDSVSVIVNPKPILVITNPPTSCESDSVDITDSSITVGSSPNVVYSYWTNSNATNPLLTPTAIAISDTNYIKITAIGGCTDIKPVITIINPLPLVNFTGLNNSNCFNSAPQLLTGNPVGGIFSGNGIVGDTFTASIAGPGTQPITYTYIDTNGCSRSASQFINILTPTNITAQLCMVTANTQSNSNIIYWNKDLYTSNVDSFIVYREVTPNNFQRIGAVSYSNGGQYTDTTVAQYFPNTGNPNTASYRYKLQILDSCRVFTALSEFHQTMHLINNNGTFSWSPYMIDTSSTPIPELTTYILLRDGNNTGNWDVIASTTPSQLSVADPNYTSYPNGRWKVETLWSITCNPSNPLNKSTSNIVTDTSTSIGIAENHAKAIAFNIYPNPYTNNTTISYSLNTTSEITIEVYNGIGQKIITLVNTTQPKGLYNEAFSAKELGYNSGIYFVKISVNGMTTLKRIVELD